VDVKVSHFKGPKLGVLQGRVLRTNLGY